MRWQTPDPLRFKAGLNLYSYARNNPFCYKDPDGRFAVPFPIVFTLFEIGATVTFLPAIGTVVGTALIAYAAYEIGMYANNLINGSDTLENQSEANEELQKEVKSVPKKPPIRTKPKNLAEQLTLEEAKNKPSKDEDEIMKDKIKDPRFPSD